MKRLPVVAVLCTHSVPLFPPNEGNGVPRNDVGFRKNDRVVAISLFTPNLPSHCLCSIVAHQAFPDSILAEEMDPVVKEILERSATAVGKGEA